jgi:XRE family transcriptional regulator, stress-response regulator
MILVRRLLGDVLRSERLQQGRTLREVSAAARVSLGYLSEIERGQKEASSECLAAIGAALDVPLSTLLSEVSDEVAREEATVSGVTSLPASDAVRTVRAATRRPDVTNVAA